MMKTVGTYAGDEDCYEVFRDFYDQVLALRHPGYDPTSLESRLADFDSSKVSGRPIDVGAGHVLGARVRVLRNLAGCHFPSACSSGGRREVERVIVNALTQELPGIYCPQEPFSAGLSTGARLG